MGRKLVWSAAACCRFLPGQLAGRRGPGASKRRASKLAPRKAAASCRTPSIMSSALSSAVLKTPLPPRRERGQGRAKRVHRRPLTPLPARTQSGAGRSPGALSRASSLEDSFGLSRPRLASLNPGVARSHQPSIRSCCSRTMIPAAISLPRAGRPSAQSKRRWSCPHHGVRRAAWRADRRRFSSRLAEPPVQAYR